MLSRSIRADLLNDLRVLICRCRIKAAFKKLRDKGIELRVRHTLQLHFGRRLHDCFTRHQARDNLDEVDRIHPGHGHQCRLTESLPGATEIAEEVLGKFVARSWRPPFGIAGLTGFQGINPRCLCFRTVESLSAASAFDISPTEPTSWLVRVHRIPNGANNLLIDKWVQYSVVFGICVELKREMVGF